MLTERRQRVAITPDESYPIVGVYGFGRGVLLRDAVRGAGISATHLYRIAAGQIIYSRLKAFEGAFAVVPSLADGRYVSNEFPTFDVDRTRTLPAFVALVLSLPSVWAALAERITGMGARRERLQVTQFLQFEIELPPIAEQHHIVAAVQTVDVALDRAGELRARSLDFLRALREARLVANGDWRVDGGWQMVRLTDLCEVTLGFTKGRKLVGPTQQLPYLRAVNVQDGFITLDDVAQIEACNADLARYALQAGDILLLEGGNTEHVGRAWIWDAPTDPCLHQNSTIRARVRNTAACDPRFVAWALGASPARTFCFDEATQTSNVAHLGLAGARAIPVPVPPLVKQRAIADELDNARAQLVGAVRKVQHYQHLRSALVEALVTGRRTFRGCALPDPGLVTNEPSQAVSLVGRHLGAIEDPEVAVPV